MLSVATQRSWNNADDEWSSKTEWHRIVLFRPRLADQVARTIKKRTLVEGSLVSSTYAQPNGKGKKSKTTKITSWSIRADVVRKLDRGEPEPQAPASSSGAAVLSPDASDQAPFWPFISKGPPTMSGGFFLHRPFRVSWSLGIPQRRRCSVCPLLRTKRRKIAQTPNAFRG